ncbi:short-chain dehydrogenase, partial [Peziza echinospora]
KVAAITGASRGIGRAIALAYAQEGAHILAHYWGTVSSPADGDIRSLAAEIRAMGQRCQTVFGDIADPATSEAIVRRAVECFGRLDIAVGNAGMCVPRGLMDVTPELLGRHVEVNLSGNFWLVQACARQMRAQYVAAAAADDAGTAPAPDASIILVSSAAATTPSSPLAAHYTASKAGLVSLMQTSAGTLGRYGIRVNALLPGLVAGRMVEGEDGEGEWRRGMERRVPLLGRLGRPSDVAGPAVFLAGEGARYVSGAQLVVDGGAAVGGAAGGGAPW